MNLQCVVSLAFVFCLAIGVSPVVDSVDASAAVLYGISQELDALILIDEHTAASTIVGDLGIDITSSSADVGPDGRLYGFGGLFDTNKMVLFTVDLFTGLATEIQRFSINGDNGTGIAFAPDGRLFWRNNDLYQLDVANGQYDLAAAFPNSAVSLTRTPDGTALYTDTVAGLVRIDLADFSGHVIGDNGIDVNTLALAPDGQLFAHGTGGTLHLIDQVNGSATAIGTVAIDFAGMAFREVGADLNGDMAVNCIDANGLTIEIATGSHRRQFDLTGDALVDLDDLDAWLLLAGMWHGHGGAFLYGDADLDGNVDGTDFNIWNGHKFQRLADWCSADFNADGAVDGSDFGIWNTNKFQSSATSSVPEPASVFIWIVACASVFRRSVACTWIIWDPLSPSDFA